MVKDVIEKMEFVFDSSAKFYHVLAEKSMVESEEERSGLNVAQPIEQSWYEIDKSETFSHEKGYFGDGWNYLFSL